MLNLDRWTQLNCHDSYQKMRNRLVPLLALQGSSRGIHSHLRVCREVSTIICITLFIKISFSPLNWRKFQWVSAYLSSQWRCKLSTTSAYLWSRGSIQVFALSLRYFSIAVSFFLFQQEFTNISIHLHNVKTRNYHLL